MPTSSMLKAKGLQTFANYLSAVPEGALFEAENVIIDRDGVVEPRRGIKINGELPAIAKQLLTYKNHILAHYENSLAFSDGNDPATFTSYKKQSTFTSPGDVSTIDDTITIQLHGLSEDDEIVFTTAGTLPAPLIAFTTYFITLPTQDTFKLSATAGGSVINLTTTGTGTHTATYDFVIEDVDATARIKGIELNSNFYVTTANGIKKLSGLNEFYIQDAGVPKALDMTVTLDLTSVDGFLAPQNETSYRHTWSYTDINGNFLEGTASYMVSIFNPDSSVSRNTKVSFPIPAGIANNYSYRIYRSAQTTGTAGDEQRLVYEAQVTDAELAAGAVTNVIDQQPEDLQANGTPLYSNEFSGEGASQTNDVPPIAKDIAVYKNIAFYANTTTNHKFNLQLLGQDGLVFLDDGSLTSVSAFIAGFTTFTFAGGHGMIGDQDIVLVDTTVGGKDGTWPAIYISPTQFKLAGDFSAVSTARTRFFTSYITITKGTSSSKYYFVGTREKSRITVAATGPGAAQGGFSISTANDEISYYTWLNDVTAGTPTIDPVWATDKISLKIDYIGTGGTPDTASQIAVKVANALTATGYFNVGTTVADIFIDNIETGPATDIGTYSPGTFSTPFIRGQGFGEDLTRNYVRRSGLDSVAARIESTAKSLVYVINQNEDEVVNAFYTSSPDELPGNMSLESKITDTTPFSIIASTNHSPTDITATTGSMFSPSLTTSQVSENESFPNKIYFSKVSQPEAVPISNSISVGPKDKAILRILGLRDSLFILKEEGIYRLTGESTSTFSVSLFDSSAILLAPDTAAILNNQIYALTSQGIATISETGVGIISRPIENIFNRVTSPDYTTYQAASFAFGYEADRAYLLFTVDKPDDTYATKMYRYNTFTQCWTSWKKSATCGIVETNANKLYLGAADVAAVEIERKRIISRDYVDREYTRTIASYSDGFVLDNTTDITVGDSLEQTQYLTPFIYNQLVRKAKLDSLLSFDAAFPEITAPATDLKVAMSTLTDELNSADTSLYTGTFNGTTNVAANVISIAGHTLINGDVIKLTGATLPSPLVADTYYAIVNAVAGVSIQLSLAVGGSPIVLTPAGGSITINELYVFTDTEDFADQQADFNYNVDKLNLSPGAFFASYKLSEGTTLSNTLIIDVEKTLNKVTTQTPMLFLQGPITHYKSIHSIIVWAPIALGEPSLMKQIRSGTFLIENDVLAGATVGHASDLSGNFEDQSIGLGEDGNWGEGTWGEFTWGGDGTSVPMRVLIPRQKQRCRYIKARFKHSNAFNKFSILGISYTFEMGSERAYR